MKKFLEYIKENVDLNKQLLDASENVDLEKVKELVEQGADIETENNDGDTPLDYEKDDIWSILDIQELLMEQNPANISLLKKHGISIHPKLKNKYPIEDIGSDFGSI